MYFRVAKLKSGNMTVLDITPIPIEAEEVLMDNMRKKRIDACWKRVKQEFPHEDEPKFTKKQFLKCMSRVHVTNLTLATECFIEHAKISRDEVDQRCELVLQTFQEYLLIEDSEEWNTACLIYCKSYIEIFYLVPTMWLQQDIAVMCYLLLQGSADLSHDSDLDSLLTEHRKDLFLECVYVACGNKMLRSVMREVQEYENTFLNMLTLSTLRQFGTALGRIHANIQVFKVPYLQIKSVEVDGPIMAETFARAVIDLADNGVDGCDDRRNFILSEAQERMRQINVQQIRMVRNNIADGKPTQPIAHEHENILKEIRTLPDGNLRQYVYEALAIVDQQIEEERAMQEAKHRWVVEQLLHGEENMQTVQPKNTQSPGPKQRKNASRRKRGAGKNNSGKNTANKKSNKATGSKSGTQDFLQNTPEQERIGIEKYLAFLKKDVDDLIKRLNAIERRDDQPVDPDEILQLLAELRDNLISAQQDHELPLEELKDRARHAGEAFEDYHMSVSALGRRDRDSTKFDNALNNAIHKERLVYGRCQGGVIQVRLGELIWEDISAKYHGFVPTDFYEIWVDDVLRDFEESEGIALYVTQSSLSGYNFDISAHLWRRRPDADPSAPLNDESGYADRVNWYDTYISCFVLHVP